MELDVLVLCGSVRDGSINRALAELAVGSSVDGVRAELWRDETPLPRLAATFGIPLPDVITRLRERVARADAVLFVTPETNRSAPGYVKDLVDWLGLRAPPRPLARKVCALMSASPDRHGGAFAQLQLADLLRRADASVVSDLDVAIGEADMDVLASDGSRGAVERLLEKIRAAVASSREARPA